MKTIGLLCPDAADPYLARALACLEHAFRQKHYDCLLSCTNRDLAARRQGVELLTSRHVDGMVLMGSTFIEETRRITPISAKLRRMCRLCCSMARSSARTCSASCAMTSAR